MPVGKNPSAAALPSSSPFAIFKATGAMAATAFLIPAALSFVFMMMVLDLNMSTPGFSSYMPVSVGMPSCALTSLATVPQATP